MMKRAIILLIIPFIASTIALAQNAEDLWTVEGKVVNATSKEPISARIIYESLPYASNIGFLSGDNFSFNIPREKEYRLRIEAEGFAPFSYNIGLHDFQEGHFFTIVELMPSGENQLIRLEKLIFAIGKSTISEDSYGELDQILEMMNKNPDMVIQLEGHTDYRGNAKANKALSEERVEATRDYLISKGIAKKRIKTKAFGGTQPLTQSYEEREINRRVEVRIIAN